MDPKLTFAYVDTAWDKTIVPALTEYIRIPNKSPMFDPDWEANGHMREAVEMLAEFCEQSGIAQMHHEIITLPGRTPVLFCDIPSTGGEGTVLLYGHYDKQPEFMGWNEGLGPWTPVLDDGKLYGRGGADDGYALFGSLTAIGALEEQGVAHARCVVLIEGCEESGSFDLPFYVDTLKSRIGSLDLVVCLDAECGNYDQLWITTSLRGMLPGTLNVRVLDEGVHSGIAGGIVPSSFRLMRDLYDRVENATTGQLHESLYADIPAYVEPQLGQVAQVLGSGVRDRFPWAGSTQPDGDDTVDMLVANAWRPSLATVGLSGAPEVADAGNTLRPSTKAKLVFRLPPIVDAATAAATIKDVLEADPPNNAEVSFELETAQTGWCAPEEQAWLADALALASEQYFGKPVMHMGMGGTIPFMKMLGDAYPDVQFMVTGVLGPQSNAHGPNEFLHIETGKRVTASVATVLAAHANRSA